MNGVCVFTVVDCRHVHGVNLTSAGILHLLCLFSTFLMSKRLEIEYPSVLYHFSIISASLSRLPLSLSLSLLSSYLNFSFVEFFSFFFCNLTSLHLTSSTTTPRSVPLLFLLVPFFSGVAPSGLALRWERPAGTHWDISVWLLPDQQANSVCMCVCVF